MRIVVKPYQLDELSRYFEKRFSTAANAAKETTMHGANLSAGIDAKREPQVGAAVTRLSNALERISNQVDLLEQRISPALRPTQPTPAVAGNRAERPHEVKAPVAEAIDALAERAAQTETRVIGILERVEV